MPHDLTKATLTAAGGGYDLTKATQKAGTGPGTLPKARQGGGSGPSPGPGTGGGSAPDPTPRRAGAVGAGRQGTYTHPKSGKPRKIVKPIGRRVKTSMVENF